MNQLTPKSIRLDLKCGKGSISAGERCTKGSATKAKSKSSANSNLLNKALVVGGAAAAVGGTLYGVHKYNQSVAIEKQPIPKGSAPEVEINRGRKAFKEANKIPLAAQIAGAGIAAAGVGIAKYGIENKNAAATIGGMYISALGAQTIMASNVMRSGLNQSENEFEFKSSQYKSSYYEAQKQAKQRQKQAGNYYSNSRISPNKTVVDPFKDLGVGENASDAEIKRAWLKLMRANHPDAGGDSRKATQINAAYQEILRRRGRKDSVYAGGFDIDWSAIQL